jgi:hypothetical protein
MIMQMGIAAVKYSLLITVLRLLNQTEQIPYGRINYLLVYALSDTLLSLFGPSGSGNYENKDGRYR